MLFESFTVLLLIASSFAATNVDNLALLVGWLMDGRGEQGRVFRGHLLGMFVLLVLSCAFGYGANVVPVRYVGVLGLIPIALGLRGLYAIARPRAEGVSNDSRSTSSTSPGLVLSIALTQVANGVDTVLVFGPLLADSEAGLDFVMMVGFVGMAFVWFQLARVLEKNAARLRLLDRYGHWVAPIVLITVGLYILADTATDVFPTQ